MTKQNIYPNLSIAGRCENLFAQFMNGLSNNLRNYEEDILSNEHAVHVTGTEEQAKCEKWKIIRKFRITATSFESFAKNPKVFIGKKHH